MSRDPDDIPFELDPIWEEEDMSEAKEAEVPTPVNPEEAERAIKADVRKTMASTAFQQYTTVDDKYFRPANSTKDSLPAGMYRVLADQSGLFFAKDSITSDTLMVLPDSKTLMIMEEIKKFRKLKKQYKKFGLLHKRGILLYGPPGSGKSSTIMLLARDMIEVGDIILMCQDPNLVSEALRVIRDIEPHRNVMVVLEDLDDIIKKRGEHLLLNVLDGDHQVDNIVFLATTNYIDELPPRIVNRPSRFDRLVEVDMPGTEARKLYFTNKTGSHLYTDTAGKVYDLAALTNGLSLAHLREVIASVYCLDISVDEVISRMKKMATPPKTKYGMMDRKMGISQEEDYNGN